MARVTRLKLLTERPASDDGDPRPVTEAFPVPPPPVPPNSQLANDVLALLRRDTDHAIALASHANTTATGAAEVAQRADQIATAAVTQATTLTTRADQVEAQTRELGQRTLTALAEQTALKAKTAAAAGQLGALFIHVIAYLLDRAPALVALLAAVWLWAQVLADPTRLRLVGLALFGVLVIAPALWLSARRHGS